MVVWLYILDETCVKWPYGSVVLQQFSADHCSSMVMEVIILLTQLSYQGIWQALAFTTLNDCAGLCWTSWWHFRQVDESL